MCDMINQKFSLPSISLRLMKQIFKFETEIIFHIIHIIFILYFIHDISDMFNILINMKVYVHVY